MRLLKEHVRTLTYRSDPASVSARLVARLKELGYEVEEDAAQGELVVRCLTVALNIVFWHCYGDKLLFRTNSPNEGLTTVDVYVIPNLLRFAPGGEKLTDIHRLMSELPGPDVVG